MRGLDPRIHLTKMLDGRVKPGHDKLPVAAAVIPPPQRENFLYLIRVGIVESVPSRRILSFS
jgi:hypothetical protein